MSNKSNNDPKWLKRMNRRKHERAQWKADAERRNKFYGYRGRRR